MNQTVRNFAVALASFGVFTFGLAALLGISLLWCERFHPEWRFQESDTTMTWTNARGELLQVVSGAEGERAQALVVRFTPEIIMKAWEQQQLSRAVDAAKDSAR